MTHAFKAVALSFYSGSFYGELARRGKGIGIGLVSLLSLLMCMGFFLTLFASGLYSDARDGLANLSALSETLPAITVQDGKLSIDKPSPYTLTFGKAPDDEHIVIDTSYKETDSGAIRKYMDQHRIMLLVTANKMMRYVHHSEDGQAQAGGDLQISELKDTQPFSITHDNWRALAASANGWGMPLLTLFAFVTMFIGVFLYNLFATLFSGIAVMFFDFAAQTNLEFSAALRLASAFRIPVTFLSVVPVLLGMYPLVGISGWILWMLYLGFAVWSVRLYSRVS